VSRRQVLLMLQLTTMMMRYLGARVDQALSSLRDAGKLRVATRWVMREAL